MFVLFLFSGVTVALGVACWWNMEIRPSFRDEDKETRFRQQSFPAN